MLGKCPFETLPTLLLENVSWIKGNDPLLSFIKQHAICTDFDYGDVIMSEGSEPDGIHIIVYGMIKLCGSLHGHIHNMRINTGHKHSKRASLKPTSSNQEVKEEDKGQQDFLCSGNIIGEIGVLTKTKRTATVSCETVVQTYFLSTEHMEIAFHQFSGLKNLMWKVVATRISASLYNEIITYQGCSFEQINMHLSKVSYNFYWYFILGATIKNPTASLR